MSADQEKHFKNILGWEFEINWINFKKSEPRPTFTDSYKKECESETNQIISKLDQDDDNIDFELTDYSTILLENSPISVMEWK